MLALVIGRECRAVKRPSGIVSLSLSIVSLSLSVCVPVSDRCLFSLLLSMSMLCLCPWVIFPMLYSPDFFGNGQLSTLIYCQKNQQITFYFYCQRRLWPATNNFQRLVRPIQRTKSTKCYFLKVTCPPLVHTFFKWRRI